MTPSAHETEVTRSVEEHLQLAHAFAERVADDGDDDRRIRA